MTTAEWSRPRAVAAIDAACDRAFRSLLTECDTATIVELRVRFARAFTGAGGTLICRATVLDLGEHLGTATAEIVDESGERYVEADATCVIRREGSPERDSNA